MLRIEETGKSKPLGEPEGLEQQEDSKVAG